MLNMIIWGRIFVFLFVSVLLWFYVPRKYFESGNIVNTEYLNRIPNPKCQIPNWSECTIHAKGFSSVLPLPKNKIPYKIPPIDS